MSIAISIEGAKIGFMVKPGSPKGVPKPKRNLDADFSGRLKVAMKHGGFASIPSLAKAANCTRQAIYPYLNGAKSQIDAFLLFDLAEACHVSVSWLFNGSGHIGQPHPLDPKEQAVLALFKSLPEALQDAWYTHGEALRNLLPAAPSREFPYKKVK